MKKKETKESSLRKEIADLLAQIDEEGLLFLKQQASTIIYNATVMEMNRKNQESLLENYEEKRKKTSRSSTGVKKKKEESVYVDMSGKAKGYGNVVCGNIRVFFTLDEIGDMVYIAEKSAQSGDGGLLLYRWLKKERGDFLVDNGIKSYPSPVIDALAAYLAK